MSARRRPGPRAWIALAALLLVALELGLGALGYGREALTRPHDELGWTKEPGHALSGPGGESIRINGHGFRDRAWAAPADPRLPVSAGGRAGLRVAWLGDSNGYGPLLEVDEVAPRALERELDLRREAFGLAPREHLVMNFSQPGWTLEQQARAYEVLASTWCPDVVVLTTTAYSVRPMRPVPRIHDFPLRGFLARTALWDFAQRGLLKARRGPGPRGDERLADRAANERRMAVRAAPLSTAVDPEWDAARERLRTLAARVESDGAALVVVALPRFQEMRDESGARTAARWARASEAAGARFVDPGPEFRRRTLPVLAEVRARGLEPGAVWTRLGPRTEVALEHAGDVLFRFDDPDHYTAAGQALLAREVLTALAAAGLTQDDDPPGGGRPRHGEVER